MSGAIISTRRLVRRAGLLGIPILCSGALAAGAAGATLKVSVPARAQQNRGYTVKIDGSYRRSELTGTAYLISLIQYSPAPCKATAQLENSKVNRQLIQFYFAPKSDPSKVGIFEKHSPFTRADGFTAKALGSRRICSYLYPKSIGASSTVQPIATASQPFKVVKKK